MKSQEIQELDPQVPIILTDIRAEVQPLVIKNAQEKVQKRLLLNKRLQAFNADPTKYFDAINQRGLLLDPNLLSEVQTSVPALTDDELLLCVTLLEEAVLPQSLQIIQIAAGTPVLTHQRLIFLENMARAQNNINVRYGEPDSIVLATIDDIVAIMTVLNKETTQRAKEVAAGLLLLVSSGRQGGVGGPFADNAVKMMYRLNAIAMNMPASRKPEFQPNRADAIGAIAGRFPALLVERQKLIKAQEQQPE